MVWFKVDDNFAFHPKTLGATNSAIGLWVRAGSWCGANLTEGRLPSDLISTLGGLKRDARKLVEVGLWDEVEGGYQFRNWAEFQPTKAQVDAEREANRARQAEYRARQRNAVTNGATNAATNSTPTRPDPTRPKKKETTSPSTAAVAAGFEEFWDAYDKKEGRKAAEQKWTIALRKPGVTADKLITAAHTYIAAQKREGKHPQYTKNATTWLNGEHWNDQPTTLRPARRSNDDWMQGT